jgi:ComF family protein
MWEGLASLLLPAPCRICGRMLDTGARVPFCRNCAETLAQTLPELLCARCGRPIISKAVAEAASPPLCVRSLGAYTPWMARAILMLKYDEVLSLGQWFAGHLVRAIPREDAAFAADVVVPVPLHPTRLRQRGYNQAELIARPVARMLHVPFRSYLLVRTRPRPDKLRLTRRERWETVRGAYAPCDGARVDKLRVLLVDDVFTTGATLDACSRALRRAGAVRVAGLTVARALPSSGVSSASDGYQDLEE